MNNFHKGLWLKKYTWLVFACFLLILAGCAGNHGKINHPSRLTEKPAATDAPEKQDELIVRSSQGKDTLEPTVVTYPSKAFNDPLEFVNRPIFVFNDFTYRYALIPVSKGYLKVVPKPVLTGVNNFFSNIREPLYAVNHLFQLHVKSMGTCLARFIVNSTVGIIGLFDPADAWLGLKAQKTHLNDTLAVYGVGYGLYIVIPVLGSSDARNALSRVVEGLADPIALMTDNPETLYIQGFDEFNKFAPGAEKYQQLRDQSDDPYLFFRNFYLQGVLRDEQYKQN